MKWTEMRSVGYSPMLTFNSGNVLNDNSHTYSWDSEGRPATIDSVNSTYDALGRMVEQNRSGVYTQFVYAPTGQKIQIMNGQATTKSLVALPGGGQAVYIATGGLYYDHSDHLGSFRFASTSNRTMYFDLAYAPFGEVYANSGNTDPAFTSQRQDTVAGLYDFPAREYSYQGRWVSPDPAGLAAVDPSNPQSWNRYAYVFNNPLNSVDPLGLSDCPDLKSTCGDDPGTDTGAPGVGIWGNFGPGNPASGCGMDDITNCAHQQSNREIAGDIAAENRFGFTALSALLSAEADYNASVSAADARYAAQSGAMYIIVHCSGDGVASWECSPWGPYAQLLASSWQPVLIGDDARLRYLARGVVQIAEPGINLSMAGTAPTYAAMGGIAIWDSSPAWFTDAFNGINA